jgi:hypothetical protein
VIWITFGDICRPLGDCWREAHHQRRSTGSWAANGEDHMENTTTHFHQTATQEDQAMWNFLARYRSERAYRGPSPL